MKQCFKCKLFTRVFKLPRDLLERDVYLCGTCAVTFINKLCEWKDIDLTEELNFWKDQ